MALTATWDTIYGLSGSMCHACREHVFSTGEPFCYLENTNNPYYPWCESCAATLGLVREG